MFPQLIQLIIKEQEQIIGPIAWEEARKVGGLVVTDQKLGIIRIESDGKKIVDDLVGRYERIFGPVSREVCREAVSRMISELPVNDVPVSLRS